MVVSGYVSLGWDYVDGIETCIVYGCETPDGTYLPIATVSDAFIECSEAELAGFGLSSKGFFKVSAESTSRIVSRSIAGRKSTPPLTQLPCGGDKTKKLKVLNQ